LRVVLDALGINAPGGGRSATLNLVEGLLALDTGDQYAMLVSEYENLAGDHGQLRQIRVRPAGRLIDRLRLQWILPRVVREVRADLVHYTKNLCTFFSPCPSVATVYDLTILAYPELFPLVDVLYWRSIQRRSLASVDHVIAISQATAADICRHYKLRSDKVSVIYPGYDPVYDSSPSAGADEVRRKFGILGDYLLHVGSISRKKNLVTLVKAFALLREELGFGGQLVLVGREYNKAKEHSLSEAIRQLGLAGAVIRTGSVEQLDLRNLYAHARVCVFPSLHEGFGLVPLEAMASGVPVVVSGSSAVREVVGDAGILIDSVDDCHELAFAISHALHDKVRAQLISAGLERARRFSREACAAATWQLYQRVAGSSSGNSRN